VEPRFIPTPTATDSGKSAIDAVRTARERCWRYDWVLDLDVQAYFDNIDWELMLKALRKHTDCRWVLLYVERWLKAPVQMEGGSIVPRTAGTPQGGASGLQAGVASGEDEDCLLQGCAPAGRLSCHCVRLPGLPVPCPEDDVEEGERRIFTHRVQPAASPKALKRISRTVRCWALHHRIDLSLTELAAMHNPCVRGRIGCEPPSLRPLGAVSWHEGFDTPDLKEVKSLLEVLEEAAAS
jgi:RNA-directed DNA polymerase